MKYKMTYGVELEGLFAKNILSEYKRKRKLQEKQDGSVEMDRIMRNVSEKELKKYNEEVEEVAMGVFSRKKDLLTALKKFSEPSYYYDKSCGMHLHIGLGTDVGDTLSKIADLSFIRGLQEFGYNLCEHTKTRRRNNYCMPYSSREDVNDHFYDGDEKYKFMRNHPQGTLEFRFFAPCEHKAKNVDKFISFFTSKLDKLQSKKKIIEYVEEKQDIEVSETHKIATAINREFTFNVGRGDGVLPYYLRAIPNHFVRMDRVAQNCVSGSVDCDECEDTECECDHHFTCASTDCDDCRVEDCNCDCHNN